MPFFPDLAQLVTKWLVSTVHGSSQATRFITIATLSVVETCLDLLRAGLVQDIHRLKETLIRRTEAETDIVIAESQQRMAEAAQAANLANLPRRSDALARIERDLARLEVCKKESEITAIEEEMRIKRESATAEARARLIEAISQLRQHGGEVFFDQNALRDILRLSDHSDSSVIED